MLYIKYQMIRIFHQHTDPTTSILYDILPPTSTMLRHIDGISIAIMPSCFLEKE